MKRYFFILFILVMMTGCAYGVTQKYSTSADTIISLKNLKLNVLVNIDKATEDYSTETVCRITVPVLLYQDYTYADYIKSALIEEFKLAGIYDNKKPDITLDIRIDRVEFSTLAWGGYWDIQMTVQSSNGKKLTVESKHSFEPLFWGGVACKTAMEGFIPAVQGLLHKTFSDPNFKALLTK